MYILLPCYSTDEWITSPACVVVNVDREYIDLLEVRQKRLRDIDGAISAVFDDGRAMYVEYPDDNQLSYEDLDIFETNSYLGVIKDPSGLIEFDGIESYRVEIWGFGEPSLRYKAWLEDTDIMFYSDSVDISKLRRMLEETNDQTAAVEAD